MLINVVSVNIKLILLCNKNFMFKLKILNKLLIYIHIINVNIINVFI